MKKRLFLLNLVFVHIFMIQGQIIAREVVDKIIARVNGNNILKSDLEKKRISKNGECFTLDELITEELFCQKASERKMLPTELEIEKQIALLKVHNNLGHLNQAQFEEELKSEGFSLKEYKNQLARMLASEKLRRAEFNERVVVTSQEVEQYYNDHPEVVCAKYLIKMCPVNSKGEFVKKGEPVWDNLGWVLEKDLSSDLSFILNMKKQEVSKPVKVGTNYQLIKLEDKIDEHIKTLDESYIEIERILQEKKKEKFEKEFEKELREKAVIIYLDN